MSKLQSFLALDGADRIATFEAMGLLLYARLLVAMVPPRRWRSRFGSIGCASPQGGREAVDLGTVRRMRLAVMRALRNVPGAPNCLPQALAARWMLERRGIASDLYIGTQRAPGDHPRFHAWLKVGEEWVTGVCDEGEYALFSTGDAEVA
ncbi:lasso peptide biosynthesis B2 protein [Qipengyuania gaetbuli]|uniref:lasso peptide biosynthesis B2 protein n=1 Tax=Qipengyuania gaetbuli TaxID=266952 RepID=UPI001CFE6A15|nr:lasso peptide biosynthesis B2 protein [Qipengyuania gaetbuli]